MAYKTYSERRGPDGPWCRRCVRPIGEGEAAKHVQFTNDPDGKLRSFNGLYHASCAEPFLSMARILNLDPWSRF